MKVEIPCEGREVTCEGREVFDKPSSKAYQIRYENNGEKSSSNNNNMITEQRKQREILKSKSKIIRMPKI